MNLVPYGDNYGKRTQTAFYGINHTPSAKDGELYNCENLTADHFPIISPRTKRGLFKTLTKANGLAGRDVLVWVDGTEFFYNGVKKGNVTDGKKEFYFMGPYTMIWPDKAYYNVKKDEFGTLEKIYTSLAGQISFSDGTYAGVAAKANCIITTGTAFDFEVGDAVTISGCSDTLNNVIAIIREISPDKKTLRFYENAFHIASGTSYTEAGAITISRKLPDMEFLCVHENRMWGCKGDDIYCSNQGNPKVWMDYDGLATGSWAGGTGSAGDFTGAVSFMGYAVFMKENSIHKVYGDAPKYFRPMQSATLGVKSGSSKSFAIAGETLFFRSRTSLVRYNGGYPYPIDEGLGDLIPDNCVAGTDGRRYYISGSTKTGNVLLCYDTVKKIWLRQDDTKVDAFAWATDGLYFLKGNEIWKMEDSAVTTEETKVNSFAEYGDFYEASANKKYVKAIKIHAEIPVNSTLTAFIKCDGEDTWQLLGTLTGAKKADHLLPLAPRRCSYWRLRLEGTGDWKVYSVTREFSEGSDVH